MSRSSSRLRLTLSAAVTAALLVVSLAAGCGDDEPSVRDVCSEGGVRLALDGQVGPTAFSVQRNEPYGGRLAATFLTPPLEDGDDPHVLALTTNTALDLDLWTALLERLGSGAVDADTVTVATRPDTVPCDPRDGQLCASYGLDTNGDGILRGTNEVIYPVASGELHITEVTGNVLAVDFDLTFGPASSGEEPGSEAGGRLQGCFHFFRSSNRQSVF